MMIVLVGRVIVLVDRVPLYLRSGRVVDWSTYCTFLTLG